MKKVLLFTIIAAILFSLALCSCEDNSSGNESTIQNTSGAQNTSDVQSSSESQTSSEEPAGFVPHLGEANYSGRVLKILTTWDHLNYAKAQIAANETINEPVNDAFYERNMKLEEEYGFTIEGIFTDGWDAFTNKVRNDFMGGTADYDVLATGAYYLAPLATDGLLLDLYQIKNSHLSLDKEWWDVSSNQDMSIDGSLYFTTGDIFVLDDEYTDVIYFNKDIIEKLNLENPYDLVHENKWTIDKMYEMVKAATQDDGDGKMTVTGNDVWGLVGAAFDLYTYIAGCDCPQVGKDDQDIPYLAMGDEKNVNAFYKAHDMISDNSHVAYIEKFYAWNDTDAHKVADNFYSGKALFMTDLVQAVGSDNMRNANIHYGILPLPKYDENQENYTSPVNPYAFFCLSIPDNSPDIDFITFALESMAYTSMVSVEPEYYERTLKIKRFTDDDSPDMLDIIFSNRVVDISNIYNWSDCIQYYNRLLVQNSASIMSFLEAEDDAFNLAMETTIEAIKAHKG